MSANSLTKSIISFLNFNGFVVWNVYNGAVYNRNRETYLKNPTKKLGVFDICGFRKSDGKHIEIEIKFGRDKMSDHQIRHKDDLEKSGCLVFVARNFDDFLTWYRSIN